MAEPYPVLIADDVLSDMAETVDGLLATHPPLGREAERAALASLLVEAAERGYSMGFGVGASDPSPLYL